jgi:hypothetical protein
MVNPTALSVLMIEGTGTWETRSEQAEQQARETERVFL